MNVQILHLVEGAKKATGLTVIIDVFRAFTVETYLMRNHAERIIPVGDVQIAFDYKKEHPDAILCGERKGVIIDGFDYGNSPSQIENVDFTGKTVIHTTSAGTQGIANAIHADEIIAGNLVSAKAIADYIKRKKPENVSLVCMGLNGDRQTEEDNLAGEYIKSLVEGKPLADLEARIESLKYTSGAKFFDPAQQSVFPQRDFELCIKVNSFPFVLRLKKDPDSGLAYMERINLFELENPEDSACSGEETPVQAGDMITSFTREQVLCFPQQVKSGMVYRDFPDPGVAFDAALVLGSRPALLETKAKKAAELYHSGRCKLFIPTGGVCWDSPFGCISEAEILARYMMEAGVPESCILLEDRASTTQENMIFSQKLLSKTFLDRKLRLAVITVTMHMVRSLALAKAYIQGAEYYGIPALFPQDNAQEYMDSPFLASRLNSECRLLWSLARRGIIPDFPVL